VRFRRGAALILFYLLKEEGIWHYMISNQHGVFGFLNLFERWIQGSIEEHALSRYRHGRTPILLSQAFFLQFSLETLSYISHSSLSYISHSSLSCISHSSLSNISHSSLSHILHSKLSHILHSMLRGRYLRSATKRSRHTSPIAKALHPSH
jgi:hypothetical protein